MRRPFMLVIVVVGAVVLSGCSGSDSSSASSSTSSGSPTAPGGLGPAGPGTGGAAGNVVDDEASPVVGAEVAAIGLSITTRTDQAGAFRLEGIPAGPQDLRFQADGFTVLVRHVLVVADEDLELGPVQLERLPDGGSKIRIDRLATKTAQIVCAVGYPAPGVTAIPKDDQCSKNNQLAGSADPSIVTFNGLDLTFSAMVIQGTWQKSGPASRAPVLSFYLTGAVLAEHTVERRLAWPDGTNDMGIEGVPGFRWVFASTLVDQPLWKNAQAPLRIRAMAADGNQTLAQNPGGATNEGTWGVIDQRVDLVVSLVYGTNQVAADYDGFKV